VVQRSPYRGRIGDGVDLEKWGSGRGFLRIIYGVKIENLRTEFSQIPTGKISVIFFVKFFGRAGKFLKIFLKSFLEIIFGVGKYFRENHVFS
jgi:hypothetical protein